MANGTVTAPYMVVRAGKMIGDRFVYRGSTVNMPTGGWGSRECLWRKRAGSDG